MPLAPYTVEDARREWLEEIEHLHWLHYTKRRKAMAFRIYLGKRHCNDITERRAVLEAAELPPELIAQLLVPAIP